MLNPEKVLEIQVVALTLSSALGWAREETTPLIFRS
jgi:hypothetical protein